MGVRIMTLWISHILSGMFWKGFAFTNPENIEHVSVEYLSRFIWLSGY